MPKLPAVHPSERASYSARLSPRPSWQPSLPTAHRPARDAQLPLDSACAAGRRRCKATTVPAWPVFICHLSPPVASTWPVLAWPVLVWPGLASPVCLHRPPVSVPPTACPCHRPALMLGRQPSTPGYDHPSHDQPAWSLDPSPG